MVDDKITFGSAFSSASKEPSAFTCKGARLREFPK